MYTYIYIYICMYLYIDQSLLVCPDYMFDNSGYVSFCFLFKRTQNCYQTHCIPLLLNTLYSAVIKHIVFRCCQTHCIPLLSNTTENCDVWMCVYIYIYDVWICVHIYIYIYIYTYTFIPVAVRSLSEQGLL